MSVQEVLVARLGAVLSTIVIIVPGPGTGVEQPELPASAPSTVTVPAVPQASPVPSAGLSRNSPSAVDASVPVSAATVIQGRGGTVRVTDAASLTSALSAAQPGQTIEMADGTYSGKFVINTAGQQGNPITLKGSRKAVLDGGDLASGYTLHLNGASYWQLVGFSVTGGQKGVMADRTSHSLISGLDVGNTGQEAVHLLNFSTSNVVQNSVIHDTGKGDPQFGEGLYFGTAKSNWAKKSGGKPDKSDNNKAIANTFRNITAENIDVKEVIWGRGRELVTSVAAPSGRSGVSSVRLLAAGWGPGLGVGW
ncbi:hypothetical protein [Pseudonocardia spinosispora]|uniref:hypothetical protein n=1 Tax=Pseudonocardia spinosispora TaxID=103441 RepID=UPI00040FBF9D|nr:hypothetical protein [Pseudonocardia spinosispora]